MPISKESAALRKCIIELELSFKSNLDEISVFLFQDAIITKRTYNEVRSTTSMQTPDDRAHLMLEKLTDAVELDKDIYYAFLAYLRTEPVAYKVPLKRLAAAEPTLNRSASTQEENGEEMANADNMVSALNGSAREGVGMMGESNGHALEQSEEAADVAQAVAVLTSNEARKKYKIKLSKIPKNKESYLDEDIESDEHVYQIADHLTGWDAKPFLLKLKKKDVSDIQEEHRCKPKQQRFAAVDLWKNRSDNPTYRSILCICVQGEWMDGATEVVNILKNI